MARTPVERIYRILAMQWVELIFDCCKLEKYNIYRERGIQTLAIADPLAVTLSSLRVNNKCVSRESLSFFIRALYGGNCGMGKSILIWQVRPETRITLN